jgi:hypothetical protein
MSKNDVKKLYPGLYKLSWKSGGVSLAAVGLDAFGRHWFAPTNWVTVPCFDWQAVQAAEPIESEPVSCLGSVRVSKGSANLAKWSGLGILSPKGIYLEVWANAVGTACYVSDRLSLCQKGSRFVVVEAAITPVTKSLKPSKKSLWMR